MIRIAFIVHGMQTGGIERSVTRVIKGLNREKFEVIVICLDRSGPAANWLADDIPVFEIKKRSGNDFLAIKRLANLLRHEEIDIVQSHNWGTLIETAVARKIAGVGHHIHAERGTVLGQVVAHGWKHRVRSAAMKVALKTVDRVMSNSYAVAQRVESRCGYAAERITVIPNGVEGFPDCDQQLAKSEIRNQLRIKADAVMVGSVGRLEHVKGYDILIDAFGQIPDENAHLILIGDGSEKESLENLVRHQSIENRIHFVGHQNDVSNWLAALDIYVNSSRSEGMSQSIVEAMSVGLPIVATDVGDATQMIHRENLRCGEICVPENAESLTGAMTVLLSDTDLRRRLGNNALSCHRKHYSESKFIKSMEKLYKVVVDSRCFAGPPCKSELSNASGSFSVPVVENPLSDENSTCTVNDLTETIRR